MRATHKQMTATKTTLHKWCTANKTNIHCIFFSWIFIYSLIVRQWVKNMQSNTLRRTNEWRKHAYSHPYDNIFKCVEWNEYLKKKTRKMRTKYCFAVRIFINQTSPTKARLQYANHIIRGRKMKLSLIFLLEIILHSWKSSHFYYEIFIIFDLKK